MKRLVLISLSGFFFLQAMGAQASPAVAALQQSYHEQGVTAADPRVGKQFWDQSFMVKGEARRCSSCHTSDPRSAGKHATTGKAIEPMAPSVNIERLTDIDKINKWFKRNCKWTVGRECTAQEKADVLAYLNEL